MTKKQIIGLSITVFIVVITAVLFGLVFRLKNQSVSVVDSTPIAVDKEEIISTAGLKNGKSIFLIDKDKAIQNIEAKYPHIKVVQIKTIGLRSIDIKVRARHEMFYTKFNENYYILDEELKVLQIVDEQPVNLSQIKEGDITLTEETKVCDFVGTNEQQKVTNDLFVEMSSVATKFDGTEWVYLTREDIRETIKTLDFEKFETFNKIIIETNYGVKLDIENPSSNLQHKINVCFSTIKTFVTSGDDTTQEKATKGTIKIYYGITNELQTVYIPE